MLRSFAAPQPPAVSTPVGCRRHPLSGELAAIEVAPPLIVQLCIIVMGTAVVVIIADRRSPSRSACVFLNPRVLLLLEKSRHTCKHYVPTTLHIAVLINPLGILRLFIIPGFAENLPSCNARFVPGPSLASTHFGPQRPWGAGRGNLSFSTICTNVNFPF